MPHYGRRRRRKVTPDMYRKIAELAQAGASAPMIAGEINAMVPEVDDQISERTILDVMHEVSPQPGKWWRLADSDPEDAPLVFEVMAARARESEGRKWWVSQAEAAWVIRVRRARPDLSPSDAYRLARLYVRRHEEPGSSEWDLTAEVALPPDLYRQVAEQYGSFAWGRPLPEEVDDDKA